MLADRRKAIAEARLARQELGAGLEGPFANVLGVIEGPGGVPVTIDALPEGMAGALQIRRGQPFILVNGMDDPARQRFTLAHEFGHWRLGHGEVVDGQQAISGNTNDPDEAEANSDGIGSVRDSPFQGSGGGGRRRSTGMCGIGLLGVLPLWLFGICLIKCGRRRFPWPNPIE